MFGPCIACKRVMGFNPIHVPSLRVNGVREPVCRECIEQANPKRKANGIAEIQIHPEAYEPAEESEL